MPPYPPAPKTINQQNGGKHHGHQRRLAHGSAELIRAELEKRLPSETRILGVEPDSFYHEGREVRTVNVIYTGADPYGDYRLLNEISRDITLMFWELDFDPTPGFEFKREGGKLV